MVDTQQDIAGELPAAEMPAAEAPVEVVAEAAPEAAPAAAEEVVAAPKRRGRKPKAAPVEPVVEAAPAPVAKTPAKRAAKPAVKAKAPASKAPAPKAPAPKAKPVTKIKLINKKPAKLAVKRAAPQPAPQKETVKMATKTKATDFTAKFQESFKEQAEKAKAAFGDAGEFAKGNVEAVVTSTKILATGVKSMGETYVAESKSAYETLAADLKEFTAVKSPTEFFELQSKLLRKNFDAAVASGSKKSEEMLKLANEAFQPISTRLSLAMEKFKQAA